VSCIDGLFQFSQQSKCPGCNKKIEKKDFSETNIDGQNYNREATVRKQIERKVCMSESDFGTLTEFNDHLEFVMEIVYDMTYGGEEEKAAAEITANKFYDKNKLKVEANWLKKDPLKNKNGSSNGNLFSSSSSCSSSSSSSSSFELKVPLRTEILMELPHVEGQNNILHTDAEIVRAAKRQYDAERSEHHKAAAISKEAEMQYMDNRRMQKIKLRRVGGFRVAYQAQRQQEEAFTDLFYFFRGEYGSDAGLPVNIESD